MTIDDLALLIHQEFQNVYKRFDEMDRRFDAFEARMGGVEKPMDALVASRLSFTQKSRR